MAAFDRNWEDFEALYQRYSREVWALAYARLRDGATAEDVTQEAFLRLCEQLDNGETIFNPGAWLLRVAHNLAEDHAKSAYCRHRDPRPQEMMGDLPSRELTPDEAALREEQWQEVRQAEACFVATLTPAQRQLYALRYGEGLVIRTIGQRVGMSRTATGEVLQHLDLRRTDYLRKQLAHLLQDIEPTFAPASNGVGRRPGRAVRELP